MKLPFPQPRYTPAAEAARNRDIEKADDQNAKTNKRNFFPGSAGVCIQAPNGTWYQITVSNTGTLSATPVTP